MEDSQVERQWTKFQHNFTSAYNFTPSELENLGKLGMDLGPRIVWDILFVTMILVGVAGNLMVLWIVTAHRYMRTIPNTFIANMSLSDLLMAVLNCSFNYVTMRDRKWDFGQAYCTINNFMAIVTVTASVLNLTAMSLDRYKAIVWPLKRRTSKYIVIGTILAIWIGSALLAIPALLFSRTEEIGPGHFICYMKWPDTNSEDHTGTSFYEFIYNVVILLATYIFPIIAIGLITIHMTIVLWWRQPFSVVTPQLERAKSKKQKIVKMLLVLVVIFGVCWLPYHVYFLYSYHFPGVRALSYIQHIFLAFYWLAMVNATVNPIVYFFMNPKFRHYYRHILLLKWLKPSAPNGATGLLLASTFGLQVAAHLAYKEEDHTETVDARSMSYQTTTSSLASSTKSNRRRTLPRPDVIILEEDDEASSQPEHNQKFDLTEKVSHPSSQPSLSRQISSPSGPSEIHRRFTDALTLVIKNSEGCNISPNKRKSMVVALNGSHYGASQDFLAEDLLDISKENEIENAAVSEAAALSTHIIARKLTSHASYTTSLFPRITQV